MIDKNAFFYNVTTRICGDLDLSKAALRTLRYLYEVMPAEEMYIALFDEAKKRYRVIVHATLSDGTLLDRSISLSSEAWRTIQQYDRKTVQIINPNRDAVVSAIMPVDGIADDGCVIVPMNLESSFVGVVLLICRTGRSFTAKDLGLLASVSKPFGIALSNALAYLDLKSAKEAAEQENHTLRQLFEDSHAIVGKNSGLKQVFDMLELIAPTNSPVLLLGETGTGKELVANIIHSASSRADRPFLKMNCGAIPANLADSELFGYEKGAFTGALQQHAGRFERANGGTLLLDEIGELPLDIQTKLLRVLQEHEFERIGGTRTIHTDVRLICATNKDLKEMVSAGLFREDLYYRINVFPVTIPPLRERKEDIPMLVDYMVNQKAQELHLLHVPVLHEEDLDLLMRYNWPGNVRELQNVIERAVILRKENRLNFDCLLEEENNAAELSLNGSMTKAIQDALKKCNGKISGKNGAAALLDINPSTLRSRMKKLGIST